MKIEADITTALLNKNNCYQLNGSNVDINEVLQYADIDTVRLSFFSHKSTLFSLKETLELLKSVKVGVYLCIHCSDYWADPSHQEIPKEWDFKDLKELKSCFVSYLIEIFEAVRDSGVNVRKIQVGNEISNGLLWPYLNSPYQYVDFIKTAHLLCRQYFPSALIVLHTDLSYSPEKARQWYELMQMRNVDYDLIGLSYYPVWHGTLDNLKENMTQLYKLIGKQIILCEIGYMNTPEKTSAWFGDWQCGDIPYSPDGQKDYIQHLLHFIQHNLLEYTYPEMYYWGLFSYSSEEHFPVSLFDKKGKALPALYSLNKL